MSELAAEVGVKGACEALNVPRSRVYRERQPKTEAHPRPTPAHALSDSERAAVRDMLNSDRFMDLPPRQVYASLLDEGTYLCHWRTMYRILSAHDEVRERRCLRHHPVLRSPNCWQPHPIRSGHGTSPICAGKRNGSTTRSIPYWTSSAATLSGG